VASLHSLFALSGTWTGTSRLWMSPSAPMRESSSVATITPVVRGRFVRIDYSWAIDGEAQEGMLLFGRDAKDLVTGIWIDSWHMGDRFMICRGAAGGAAISVRGSYAAPSGPDWGWRIDVEPGDGFRLVMYNLPPGGKEELAVEATYTKTP